MALYSLLCKLLGSGSHLFKKKYFWSFETQATWNDFCKTNLRHVSSSYPSASLAMNFFPQCSLHFLSACLPACLSASPWADLLLVGMLWSLPIPFLLCSCVYFCLYCPFNRISFHEFSRHLSVFSFLPVLSLTILFSVYSPFSLFFRSYIGPFICISLWKSSSALIQSLVVAWAQNTS